MMLKWTSSEYHKRREQMIAILGGECVKCRATDDLEFDVVIPGTAAFKISTRWAYPLASLMPELEKCQLLCRSCNLEKARANSEFGPPTDHGKIAMYNHNKCRCDLCKTAWNVYQRGRLKADKQERTA